MVTPEIATTLGLAQTHGALHAGVTPGGPAEAAAFRLVISLSALTGRRCARGVTCPAASPRRRAARRSAERRGGKGGVSTGRSRWSTAHKKKKRRHKTKK